MCIDLQRQSSRDDRAVLVAAGSDSLQLSEPTKKNTVEIIVTDQDDRDEDRNDLCAEGPGDADVDIDIGTSSDSGVEVGANIGNNGTRSGNAVYRNE